MLNDRERQRYARHFVLPDFGEAGQLRLKAASVLLVGAGGLGSPAAIYLAAAGIGRLTIVDDDRVSESNLHRQVLYATGDVSQPKTAAAREHLRELNPHVDVDVVPERFTSANARSLVETHDVVIDGTDNFATRYLINDACVLGRRPNVHGSVHRFEGQLSVFDATAGPCYRCLHPDPPAPGTVQNCAEAGVLGVLPGVIGTLQALEAIKIVTGAGTPLVGRLLLFDALDGSFRQMRIAKRCHEHAAITQLTDIEEICNTMDINVKELASRMESGDRNFFLLDVREPHEWNAGHLEGAHHIPMRQVPAKVDEVPREAEVIVYCRSGARSANVQQWLRAQGFANVRNLTGGVMAWRRDVDPGFVVG